VEDERSPERDLLMCLLVVVVIAADCSSSFCSLSCCGEGCALEDAGVNRC